MAGAPPKRTSRRTLGQRRRVDDDGDDEAVPETLDHLDDDSVTEGSVVSEDNDHANDSDTSNVDETSPTSPTLKKTSGRGASKHNGRHKNHTGGTKSDSQITESVAEVDAQLDGLSLSAGATPAQEEGVAPATNKASDPVVVSSTSAPEAPFERRRREHEEYRKKRDEDPAFVPNRGTFFMHDHRHSGPAANGFRPYGQRGAMRGGRGRGRGGFGGPFAPVHTPFQANLFDPTVSGPWVHDMHETVTQPMPMRQPRQSIQPAEGLPNGDGHIPTRPPSDTPINRTLSTEKPLGNVDVRMFFPGLKESRKVTGVAMKRYTMLPDHRPPLRRDKPVRISLPGNPPRYVFPAIDRSFIFIPRAMRPNQQRVRGRSRGGFGSVGGYSRRTSVYGGSYYGSVYTPSVGGMSRRSSIAPGDFVSPTGSAMSRPIVRLPPMGQPQMQIPMSMHGAPPVFLPPPAAPVDIVSFEAQVSEQQPWPNQASINDLPQPQTHPLPQKPTFQETTRPGSATPIFQPRPQKTVSLQNIELPTGLENTPQQYQQAFHQQVPPQVVNSLAQDALARNPYPSQASTGTPLSQIPERAIHAAPFQPSTYPQPQPQSQAQAQGQPGFYNQPYQMMPPQPGYYYPPQYSNSMAPSVGAAPFYPGPQQAPGPNYSQGGQAQATPVQSTDQSGGASTLVAQDVNGTVYFYDASQIPAYPTYPAYNAPGYAPNMAPNMGMGMSPVPEGYYYNQATPGMPPY